MCNSRIAELRNVDGNSELTAGEVENLMNEVGFELEVRDIEILIFNCVSVSNSSLFDQGNFTSLPREKLIGFHRSGFRI